MMGLLDILKSEDPAVAQGLLQAGLSLLGSKGGLGNALGQAGMQGLQGASQFRQQQFQRQLQQTQLDEAKRRKMMQEREDNLSMLPGKFIVPPSQQGMDATGGMETALEAPQNQASPMGRMDLPGLAQAFMAAPGGLQQGMALHQSLLKEEPKLQEIDPTKSYGTWAGGKFNPIVQGTPKPDLTADQKDYAAARAQGYSKSFMDYQREMANLKAPKTSVSVSTGQKGYENESKLRNDFKSEPIYKDFQDMQSAHKQIKAGIQQGTPIGDVATATKIMKLLDPGSVVRESELGIAMAAGGRMDRMRNYVQMQMSGEKLTPQMRKDFGALADELYKAAAQSYNQKRGEYEQMGKRYQLDPSVLGAPAVAGKVVDFGSLR